jgi:hypothetical protein
VVARLLDYGDLEMVQAMDMRILANQFMAFHSSLLSLTKEQVVQVATCQGLVN